MLWMDEQGWNEPRCTRIKMLRSGDCDMPSGLRELLGSELQTMRGRHLFLPVLHKAGAICWDDPRVGQRGIRCAMLRPRGRGPRWMS
jgi:hypothetical protein